MQIAKICCTTYKDICIESNMIIFLHYQINQKPAATGNSGINIMATKEMIIGQDLTIWSYSTKQKGYGRQGLYLSFLEIEGNYYMCDLFPNLQEHFDYLTIEDAFEHNRDIFGRYCKKYYTDCTGNGEYDVVYDDDLDFLKQNFEGEIVEIEIDEEEEEI